MDLGTVVLKPASGVIEVEITNWDPNLKYTITLYQYLSMPLEFRIPMKGPTHRFERLSLRWYSVSVENADKQVGSRSKNARLSEKQPTIKLKFEMSKPPLPDSIPDPEPKEE